MKQSQHFTDFILTGCSFIIGLVGLSTAPRFGTLVLAVPVLWTLAGSRWSAFLVMLAYKLAASRGLLTGAAVFLSENHTAVQAALLYFFMSFGASLPFLVFWSKNWRRKAICLILAFLTAYVLPPLSLIGIINPLMASGTVFKGFGIAGMLLALSACALCAVSRRSACLVLCVVALFTVLPGDDWFIPSASEGFVTVDTSFGRLGSGSFNFGNDYERAKMVFSDLRRRRSKLGTEAKVIVLPETIAGRLNKTGLTLWREEVKKLLGDGSGTAVIFGAELPAEGGAKYDNAAILLHENETAVARQRIPVPYSMYRGPFAEVGARLHLFDEGILALPEGRRAAVIICYEAYLTWPYLVSMLHRPDVLVSIANLWWCRETSLPVTQRNVASLWALTFGVPFAYARNI